MSIIIKPKEHYPDIILEPTSDDVGNTVHLTERDVLEYDFENCEFRRGTDNFKDIIAAMLATKGEFNEMSVLLGRNRRFVKKYVDTHHQLLDIWRDIREATLDRIEYTGMDLALKGDGSMIRFYLSTQGKDRGYTTRVENTGKDGEPLYNGISTNDPNEASKQYQKIIEGNEG